MLFFSAYNVHITSEHHIILNATKSDAATRSDIDSLSQFNTTLAEAGSELYAAIFMALGEGKAVELLPDKIPRYTREKAE
jgi:hypothetical protein